MTEAAAADPLREQVEAALHHLIAGVTMFPCAAVGRVSASVAGPIALVRSLVELSLASVFGAGATPSAPAGPEPVAPAAPQWAAVNRTADPAAAIETYPAGGFAGDLADLALEGYESLAASQVVARLERLQPAELERIRDFEANHRGRRTILGKIEQLLARA